MAKYYTIAIKNNNVMEGLNEKLEEICFNSKKSGLLLKDIPLGRATPVICEEILDTLGNRIFVDLITGIEFKEAKTTESYEPTKEVLVERIKEIDLIRVSELLSPLGPAERDIYTNKLKGIIMCYHKMFQEYEESKKNQEKKVADANELINRIKASREGKDAEDKHEYYTVTPINATSMPNLEQGLGKVCDCNVYSYLKLTNIIKSTISPETSFPVICKLHITELGEEFEDIVTGTKFIGEGMRHANEPWVKMGVKKYQRLNVVLVKKYLEELDEESLSRYGQAITTIQDIYKTAYRIYCEEATFTEKKRKRAIESEAEAKQYIEQFRARTRHI